MGGGLQDFSVSPVPLGLIRFQTYWDVVGVWGQGLTINIQTRLESTGIIPGIWTLVFMDF